MLIRRLLCWTWFSLAALPAWSQLTVTGTVLEDEGSQALEFAQVAWLSPTDSSTLAGAFTDAEGRFSLSVAPGTYLLRVSYLGYEPYVSAALELDGSKPTVALGTIRLVGAGATLEEVEIASRRSMVEFSLDKRVFHVGQDLSNAGSTASEILSNVPSVSVDTEGNIQLRGSGEVRILIDGRPSSMATAKGLRQLQGNLIESIEVITNPSARYEAEGNAGIINIVLKKEKKDGLNGSFEIITGQPVNYGVAANVNYRVRKLNFFLNYGISYRISPNISSLYQEVYANDTTFVQRQHREGTYEGLINNIRGGLDYYFNEHNILTGSYRFQRSDGQRFTDLRYEDYLFSLDQLVSTSLRTQNEQESEPYSEYVLSYRKLFERKGRESNADIRYLNYWENSDQLFEEKTFFPWETPETGRVTLERAINDEFENQYLIQLDYVHPFGAEGKAEAGVRSSFRDMTNDFIVTTRDDQGQWVVVPEFDNIFVYQENIHAAYGILGNKTGKISYQAGLRVEATDVKTTLEKTNEVNPRVYQNLFPSAHISYELPKQHALQISYSRRVRRPEYRELSPFVTLADGRNFFSGNPDLDPEFTDAFEIGHLKYVDKGSFSSSIYYRKAIGTIMSIREVDERGFARSLPYNLVGSHSFGAEFATGFQLYKWWKLDANANFFRAIIDGTNLDATFSSDTYSWFLRKTSQFTLPKQWTVQFRANYEAPQLMPQGRRKSILFFDVSVQKELWNGKGRLTLSVLDVLNSRINRTLFEGETFLTDLESQFQRRQANLTLSYRLR